MLSIDWDSITHAIVASQPDELSYFFKYVDTKWSTKSPVLVWKSSYPCCYNVEFAHKSTIDYDFYNKLEWKYETIKLRNFSDGGHTVL
jgi:hypothetical protein